MVLQNSAPSDYDWSGFRGMAGVGGERLDVPPLPLGVQLGSSRKHRFPRPRDAPDDEELVRGMMTLIFLRLCWRAPLMMISFIVGAETVWRGVLKR